MRRLGRVGRTAVAVAGLSLLCSAAYAQPWVGSANYGPETVGPFDTYDFALGPVLLKGAQGAGAGDLVTGYYQAYVDRHLLNGVGINERYLDTTGVDSGDDDYEITLVATFTSLITDANGTVDFMVQGGTATLYLDDSPDYSFPGDSGFDNGVPLLSGDIVGGGGTFFGALGIGVSSFDVAFDSVNGAVYSPPGLVGGSSVFTLQMSLTGVNAVAGSDFDPSEDILLGADGNIHLVVPIPASVLLLGSGLAGVVLVGRRKTKS
ncbi:MAG: hypothetical protein Kow0092_35200 [Deferrisomatales bacterium]